MVAEATGKPPKYILWKSSARFHLCLNPFSFSYPLNSILAQLSHAITHLVDCTWVLGKSRSTNAHMLICASHDPCTFVVWGGGDIYHVRSRRSSSLSIQSRNNPNPRDYRGSDEVQHMYVQRKCHNRERNYATASRWDGTSFRGSEKKKTQNWVC